MFSSSPASSGRRQVGFSSASLASSTARRWVRARSPGSVKRSLPSVSSSSSTGRMTARAQRWSVLRNSTITSRSPSTLSSQLSPSSQSSRSGKTNSSVSRSLDSALANVCTGSGSGTLRIAPAKGVPRGASRRHQRTRHVAVLLCPAWIPHLRPDRLEDARRLRVGHKFEHGRQRVRRGPCRAVGAQQAVVVGQARRVPAPRSG